MKTQKVKYFSCILTLFILSLIFYLTIYENQKKLNNNLSSINKLFTPSHYSFDRETFFNYNSDFNFLNTSYDKLYIYGKVNFTNNLNKFLLIKSYNADINLYTSSNFFTHGDPMPISNNIITNTRYDIDFFNLASSQGSHVVFEITKTLPNHDMFLISCNAISKNNLYNYIVKFIQTYYILIGIALGCIFLISTVMFYKIYRQYYLHILLIILLLIIMLFISTTSYFKHHIYSFDNLWTYITYISTLALNSITFYYVGLLERLKTRKISKFFLFSSMAITIFLFRKLSINVLDINTLKSETTIALFLFIIFDIILFIKIITSLYKYIKEKLLFKNVLAINKILLSFILSYITLINITIVANNLSIISNNGLLYVAYQSFLYIYIISLFTIAIHLSILKNNSIEMPKMLNNSRNVLNNLHKQQTILYSKDNIEDFILAIFKSAEELCNCTLSGYYIITDKDNSQKIVQGYGKFNNLKNIAYSQLNPRKKYNEKKGWHIFTEANSYDEIDTKLCVLPNKILTPNDLTILNAFFNIAYDFIFNFILLKNMFIEEKQLVYSLTEISEIRSKETGNHINRVSAYCEILGREYGLNDEDIDLLVTSSKMHDLGKLCIPDEILHKPDRLNSEEFDIIKTHAISGYYILNNCTGKYLEASKKIAKNHHEKFNGKGYYGLSGYEIDLFSRIVAIADVFDALASERSYKKAWEIDKIVSFFKEERGEHFDPLLVDIFLDNINEFIKIQKLYR